jgi:hypothetical protein
MQDVSCLRSKHKQILGQHQDGLSHCPTSTCLADQQLRGDSLDMTDFGTLLHGVNNSCNTKANVTVEKKRFKTCHLCY